LRGHFQNEIDRFEREKQRFEDRNGRIEGLLNEKRVEEIRKLERLIDQLENSRECELPRELKSRPLVFNKISRTQTIRMADPPVPMSPRSWQRLIDFKAEEPRRLALGPFTVRLTAENPSSAGKIRRLTL
jgi:hypothetical protein